VDSVSLQRQPLALAQGNNQPPLSCSVFPGYAANLDVVFKKGKETWLKEESDSTSKYSSQSFEQGTEFEALVVMGPKIIPLILHKLLDEENFVAVELYNVLGKDSTFKVDCKSIIDNHNL